MFSFDMKDVSHNLMYPASWQPMSLWYIPMPDGFTRFPS